MYLNFYLFNSFQCPETVQSSVERNMDDYEDYNNPTETPTVKSLVRLHKKVQTKILYVFQFMFAYCCF